MHDTTRRAVTQIAARRHADGDTGFLAVCEYNGLTGTNLIARSAHYFADLAATFSDDVVPVIMSLYRLSARYGSWEADRERFMLYRAFLCEYLQGDSRLLSFPQILTLARRVQTSINTGTPVPEPPFIGIEKMDIGFSPHQEAMIRWWS